MSDQQELMDLLKESSVIETDIEFRGKNFDGQTDSLLDITKKLADMKATLSKEPKSHARDEQLAVVNCFRTCNLQRIKIMTKLGSGDATYEDYRSDVAELQDLLNLRAVLVKNLQPSQHVTSEKIELNLTDYMQSEDALFIDLLIIVSGIDGSVHKKERSIIAKHYEQIALHTPDEKTLLESFRLAGKKTEDILARLGAEASDINPEIKRLMFLSAVKVALADHKLFKTEMEMLVRIYETLKITDESLGPIKNLDDLVTLIKKSRRIKTKNQRSDL